MIALWLVAAADAPMLAVPPAVLADTRTLGDDARLVWPAGTTMAVREDQGELVARFDRPIDDAAIAAFRGIAGDAIGDLRWNDDSLVLRPAPGWDLQWRQAGPVLGVAFARRADAVAGAAAADADADADAGDIDTQLLAIEADVAAGYPGQGRRAAEALARRWPDDPRVARIVADARNADGDIAGAARGYRRLRATDRTARRAQAFAPGAASIGVTARDGGDLSQVESAARADVALTDRFGIGGGVRHVATTVVAAAGTVHTGEPILDAGAAARIGDAARLQLVLAAALDSGVTGGGVRFGMGSAEAQWRAALLLHQPDYSTAEQALAGGYLSRAAFGATYRLLPGLVGQFDLGGNRYGLAGGSGSSDTLTASGGLDYIVRRGSVAFGLTYRFEAEYVQRLRAIDLATRENHTVQGLLSATLGEAQLTGLAGWTVDRFGGDGPNASLGLNLPFLTAWRIEGSGGITSIARPGFSGRQLYARAVVTRGLGNGR
jgi:hypothetical protein